MAQLYEPPAGDRNNRTNLYTIVLETRIAQLLLVWKTNSQSHHLSHIVVPVSQHTRAEDLTHFSSTKNQKPPQISYQYLMLIKMKSKVRTYRKSYALTFTFRIQMMPNSRSWKIKTTNKQQGHLLDICKKQFGRDSPPRL